MAELRLELRFHHMITLPSLSIEEIEENEGFPVWLSLEEGAPTDPGDPLIRPPRPLSSGNPPVPLLSMVVIWLWDLAALATSLLDDKCHENLTCPVTYDCFIRLQ